MEYHGKMSNKKNKTHKKKKLTAPASARLLIHPAPRKKRKKKKKNGPRRLPEVCGLKLQEGPSWGFPGMALGPVKPAEAVSWLREAAGWRFLFGREAEAKGAK